MHDAVGLVKTDSVKFAEPFPFAHDIAQFLQAHEGGARGSLSIEQLLRRLSPLLSPEEAAYVRKFFSSLIGIDCTKLIPQEAEHFKDNVRKLLSNVVLQESERKELETGLDTIFTKLASFLIRITRRGINDLRELSLITRLDAHKLALRVHHGRELAQGLDAIIEELTETILFILLREVAAAYQASGTDVAFVSGAAWAAYGTRADYVTFLLEPIPSVKNQYAEWFNRASFEEKLLDLRDKYAKGQIAGIPARGGYDGESPQPLVTCIVLGLLLDSLVVHDLESAKTLAFFLFDEAFRTSTERLLTVAPDIFRTPLQLEIEREDTSASGSLIDACRDSFQFFSRRRERALQTKSELSTLRFERDASRLQGNPSGRRDILTQLISALLKRNVQEDLTTPQGIKRLHIETGAVTEHRRNSLVVKTLSAKQKEIYRQFFDEHPEEKTEVVLTLIELVGVSLRSPEHLISQYALIDFVQFAVGFLSSAPLQEGLQIMIEAETRHAFLLSRSSTLPALRVIERFRASGGFERLQAASEESSGSLSILLEGISGQIFSQDTRFRLALSKGENPHQLDYCWAETELRIRRELETHAIEAMHRTADTTPLEHAVTVVRNLDISSRRQACLAVSLELLIAAKSSLSFVQAQKIYEFIKSYLLDEALFFELPVDELMQVPTEALETALKKSEELATQAAKKVLLSGSGPELAVRFQKDGAAARELLSKHFTAAARVARRSVLPARTEPFQKFEIAIRYAELFELMNESAARVG